MINTPTTGAVSMINTPTTGAVSIINTPTTGVYRTGIILFNTHL